MKTKKALGMGAIVVGITFIASVIGMIATGEPEAQQIEATDDGAVVWGGANFQDVVLEVSASDDVRFYTGQGEVVLNWSTGVLEIEGDPNHYTEAAKMFLTYVMTGAAYELVAADPNAIRRLGESGAICEVLGHRWVVGDNDGRQHRTCATCGRAESRH